MLALVQVAGKALYERLQQSGTVLNRPDLPLLSGCVFVESGGLPGIDMGGHPERSFVFALHLNFGVVCVCLLYTSPSPRDS